MGRVCGAATQAVGWICRLRLAGKQPVAHAWGAAVFDRVVVDIVGATLQVGFVADGVFVETPLPNGALAAPLFAGRKVGSSGKMGGKAAFNQPLVGRQRPDGVHMVGHHAGGNGFKRVLFLHGNIGGTQQVDMFHQQAGFGIGEFDGKEKRAAGNHVSAITRHGVSVW